MEATSDIKPRFQICAILVENIYSSNGGYEMKRRPGDLDPALKNYCLIPPHYTFPKLSSSVEQKGFLGE